jgi:two-component system LytT family response regulator
MVYNAIIVEDEAKLKEVLAVKIKKFCPELNIVDKAGSAKQAYASIAYYKPDIVFLDVMMPGESGFELLKMFDKINFEIIFTTGYNEYALDALKVNAADYLLKPINTVDLVASVKKAIKRVNDKEKVKLYDHMKSKMDAEGDMEDKITIAGNNVYEFIKVGDIIRCMGWEKYTKVFLTNGETVTSSYNIGVFRTMLKPYNFYSPHRSHIINQYMISKYLKEGTIIMIDNAEIPVAKRKRDEFHSIFIKLNEL